MWSNAFFITALVSTVDEVIWDRAFANFTKADISAGGGDTPIWRMLDALCGQADSTSQ